MRIGRCSVAEVSSGVILCRRAFADGPELVELSDKDGNVTMYAHDREDAELVADILNWITVEAEPIASRTNVLRQA